MPLIASQDNNQCGFSTDFIQFHHTTAHHNNCPLPSFLFFSSAQFVLVWMSNSKDSFVKWFFSPYHKKVMLAAKIYPWWSQMWCPVIMCNPLLTPGLFPLVLAALKNHLQPTPRSITERERKEGLTKPLPTLHFNFYCCYQQFMHTNCYFYIIIWHFVVNPGVIKWSETASAGMVKNSWRITKSTARPHSIESNCDLCFLYPPWLCCREKSLHIYQWLTDSHPQTPWPRNQHPWPSLVPLHLGGQKPFSASKDSKIEVLKGAT